MKKLNHQLSFRDERRENPQAPRRLFLRQAGALSLWGAVPAWAQPEAQQSPAAPQPEPLRLGCEAALVNSGLVPAWQRAFTHQTGVALALTAVASTEALQMLDRGEVHMSVTNDPKRELELEQPGLAHGRVLVAGGSFVLVGPSSAAKTLRAAITGAHATSAPIPLLLQTMAKEGVTFLSRTDGSGTHHFEQGLWEWAQVKPEGAWYRRALGDVPHWLHAKEMGACIVLEKGVWLRLAKDSGLVVLADNDPALNIGVHLMRAFRSRHPGGQLFAKWLTGPTGQWVTRRAGYRTAAQARAFT